MNKLIVIAFSVLLGGCGNSVAQQQKVKSPLYKGTPNNISNVFVANCVERGNKTVWLSAPVLFKMHGCRDTMTVYTGGRGFVFLKVAEKAYQGNIDSTLVIFRIKNMYIDAELVPGRHLQIRNKSMI